MLPRVYAIAVNTFREAVRDRVLQGVVAAAASIVLFALALGELSLGEDARVVLDVGLAAISLFGVVVAIFLGSSLLYKEIERKTLYVILPKPIRRSEFLVGKFAGIALTGAVFTTSTGGFLLWLLVMQQDVVPWHGLLVAPIVVAASLGLGLWKGRGRTGLVVPWSAAFLAMNAAIATSCGVDPWPVVWSLVLVSAEISVLTAVALVFSSFSSPFLTGVFTAGVWIVGRNADELATMRSRVLPDDVKALMRVVAEVAPNLHLFVPGRNTLSVQSAAFGGPTMYVAAALGYAALYCVVMLVVASLVFRRRDFI